MPTLLFFVRFVRRLRVYHIIFWGRVPLAWQTCFKPRLVRYFYHVSCDAYFEGCIPSVICSSQHTPRPHYTYVTHSRQKKQGHNSPDEVAVCTPPSIEMWCVCPHICTSVLFDRAKKQKPTQEKSEGEVRTPNLSYHRFRYL